MKRQDNSLAVRLDEVPREKKGGSSGFFFTILPKKYGLVSSMRGTLQAEKKRRITLKQGENILGEESGGVEGWRSLTITGLGIFKGGERTEGLKNTTGFTAHVKVNGVVRGEASEMKITNRMGLRRERARQKPGELGGWQKFNSRKDTPGRLRVMGSKNYLGINFERHSNV